ncbi:MAG: tRNA-dihydrouridine synthase [Petrotoga mobilis]|nr:MAG: tRNA-dihydrouridine synthase [Petrotoga mobilis]
MLENQIGLAPMADYTDYPFREICRRFGAEFTFTEMISVDSIIRENEKVEKMLPQKGENNIGVQLFGNDPTKFAEAAKAVQGLASWIDINAACPVNKVVKKGSGAALLKNPILLGDIVFNLKKSIDLPVGVKVRLGYDQINIEEVAQTLEKAGSDYIIVHGRTRSQMYSGSANREILKKLKAKINIPLGASGDVFSKKDIDDYLLNYGADFVLVARGAIGNPWIFTKNNYLPTLDERIDTCLEHLELMIEFYGSEVYAVKKFRKVLIKYFSGIEGTKEVRRNLHLLLSYNDVAELINKTLKH